MNRILITAALTTALLASPLLAQGKEVKRRQVFVTGDRVEVLEGSEGPQVFWLRAGGGYLGVSTTNLTEDLRTHFGTSSEHGVMVAKVFVGTPAARAGLQAGDIITAIDGTRIGTTWDINKALASRKKGEQVRIEFHRNRVAQQTTATLEERKGIQPSPYGPGTAWREAGEIGVPMELELGLERLGEALERVPLDRLPEIRARALRLSDCKELEARVESLEQKIRELEKKK
jgi:membrane-associated protease RseP (regulator of RpoE activity)